MKTFKELLNENINEEKSIKSGDQFGFKGKQYPSFLINNVKSGKVYFTKFDSGNKQSDESMSIIKFMNQENLYKKTDEYDINEAKDLSDDEIDKIVTNVKEKIRKFGLSDLKLITKYPLDKFKKLIGVDVNEGDLIQIGNALTGFMRFKLDWSELK